MCSPLCCSLGFWISWRKRPRTTYILGYYCRYARSCRFCRSLVFTSLLAFDHRAQAAQREAKIGKLMNSSTPKKHSSLRLHSQHHRMVLNGCGGIRMRKPSPPPPWMLSSAYASSLNATTPNCSGRQRYSKTADGIAHLSSDDREPCARLAPTQSRKSPQGPLILARHTMLPLPQTQRIHPK